MARSTSNTDNYGQRASSKIDKSWLNLQHHENGMIKKPMDLEQELRHPPKFDEKILDRIEGSIVGMALGDAVGAHVEFRPQSYLEQNPVKDLKGGGTWGLKKGQFTDDTSMALCLANSLVVCQDFIPYDQLVRYKWWYRQGYMSSTGKCFDIGAATKNSLEEFELRQKGFGKKYGIPSKEIDDLSDSKFLNQFDVNCSEPGVAGNGALMRLAPVPLFFYRYPEYAVKFSGISGQITHGDRIAYDACRYYGALIVAALHGEKKKELLSKTFYSKHEDWFSNEQLHPSIMEIAEGSYKGKQNGHSAGIRGKGYIVQSLEAALWAFCYDEDSFKTGVLAAVNLGDDTDTTAAIYGQLAGAYYGYKELPSEWREAVYAKKFIHCLNEWIVYEGERWRPEKPLASNSVSLISQGQSNEQKQNFNTKPSQSQTNSQKPSKVQPGSQTKTQSTDDKTSKKSTYVTQSGKNNVAVSSTDNNDVIGGSDWDDTPDQFMPTTDPKSTKSKVSTVTSPSKHPHNLLETETNEAVCKCIKSLGKDYQKYVDIFKKHTFDWNEVFNNVDDMFLKQHGVENAQHRRQILSSIQTMKEKLSISNATKKN